MEYVRCQDCQCGTGGDGLHQCGMIDALRIGLRDFLATLSFGIQVLKFYPQHGCLHFIEAAVHALV
ncbi:hypothetical protein D3C85_1929520 [compost metagenome]